MISCFALFWLESYPMRLFCCVAFSSLNAQKHTPVDRVTELVDASKVRSTFHGHLLLLALEPAATRTNIKMHKTYNSIMKLVGSPLWRVDRENESHIPDFVRLYHAANSRLSNDATFALLGREIEKVSCPSLN